MGKRPKKSAAGGEDLISELPDEILHCIIGRIACSKEATRTIALSNRWRNLWRSYPVVQLNPKTKREFYSIGSEVFKKFHDATMKRFNQDKLLQMEALKLSIQIDRCRFNHPRSSIYKFRSPGVEQLLKLASERKAKYVDIEIGARSFSSLCLPFRLLSYSSAKTLKLERIRFASCNDDLLVSLNSLRSLHLKDVRFDDHRLFTNLIASSPLLETLQLRNVRNLKKLQLSNVPNLKTLVVTYCFDLEEIEIEAYELHSLHLQMTVGIEKKMLHKIELIAPQLNDLKIINYGLRMVDLKSIICKLQYLKSLNLVGIVGFCRNKSWKLEFAGRKLEEFVLWVSRGLKEIELDADAGPSVVNFL
ncbi:F-box/FBD/LRR-repeat protein At1g78750 [Linum perenne]